MIKVTVLYNLPAGTDEKAFVEWRTTTHHAANIADPAVVKSDFYQVIGQPGIGDDYLASDSAPYRFVTESYYDSYESFASSWNDPDRQQRLVPAVAKIADALFLISEELQTYEREN